MLFLTSEWIARVFWLSPRHVCVRSGGAVWELLDFGVSIGTVSFQGDPRSPLCFLEFLWPSGSMSLSLRDLHENKCGNYLFRRKLHEEKTARWSRNTVHRYLKGIGDSRWKKSSSCRGYSPLKPAHHYKNLWYFHKHLAGHEYQGSSCIIAFVYKTTSLANFTPSCVHRACPVLLLLPSRAVGRLENFCGLNIYPWLLINKYCL